MGAFSPFDEFETRVRAFAETAQEFCEIKGDASAMAKCTRARLERALQLLKPARSKASQEVAGKLSTPAARGVLMVWSIASSLGELQSKKSDTNEKMQRSRQWFEEWLLASPCEDALCEFGLTEAEATRSVTMARVLTALGAAQGTTFDFISALLSDVPAQTLLGINRFEGVTWFNNEGMADVLDWLQIIATIESVSLPISQVQALVVESGYRVVKLLELARKPVGRGLAPRRQTPRGKAKQVLGK